MAEDGIEASRRITLKTVSRVSLNELDTFSCHRLQRVESIASTAKHLLRRIGENELVAALRKSERLMSRTAADIDDPPRRRRQVEVELARG